MDKKYHVEFSKKALKDLKKMGISMKKAKYFILCNGKYFLSNDLFDKKIIESNLILENKVKILDNISQLSLFNE